MSAPVLNMASRVATRLLPAARQQRLTILIYHRVLPQPDPMRPDEPTVEVFDWQMRVLRHAFNPLSLMEAVEALAAGTLPERAVCVTFDDGYADNETCALPILQKYQIPASVFVSTGFLNGGRMFNDSVIEAVRGFTSDSLDLRDLGLEVYPLVDWPARLRCAEQILHAIKHLEPHERSAVVAQITRDSTALPEDLMMTDAQVRNLADNGVYIGAHTVNHPILASTAAVQARAEIAQSKQQLEELLQRPVQAFAYPNGKPGADYRPEHRDMVGELGFDTALATHWGAAVAASDPLQLPRFTPWDRTQWRFMLRLLLNYRRLDPLLGSS